ncbi:Crp/Fnr family transcriptional regulator [Bradyrhizobium sp. RDT10]
MFTIGSPPSGLYALLRGSIHISHFDVLGRYRFYHVLKPTAWVGVISEADLLPQMQTTLAGDPTVLLHIDHQSVQNVLAESTRFGWDLARLAAHQARLLAEAVADLNGLTTSSRMAKALISISEPSENAQNQAVVSSLNQEMLAAIAGVSRQTINRILRRWEARKLILTDYKRITILDVHRLARIADRAGSGM